MDDKGWKVRFSMGVITFSSDVPSVDEIISRADRLMYKAKEEGKDRIIYGTI